MGLFKKLTGKKEAKGAIDMKVYSPLKGEVRPLSTVNDPVFAEEMMGPGIAVFPTVGQVIAPCNGEVLSVFRTSHAITFKADNGAEIIIHVGLETVALDGHHFKVHVADGQKVKTGDNLLTFDLEKIAAEGYDLITPVIITNGADFGQVDPTTNNQVEMGDELIQLGTSTF